MAIYKIIKLTLFDKKLECYNGFIRCKNIIIFSFSVSVYICRRYPFSWDDCYLSKPFWRDKHDFHVSGNVVQVCVQVLPQKLHHLISFKNLIVKRLWKVCKPAAPCFDCLLLIVYWQLHSFHSFLFKWCKIDVLPIM